MGRRRAIIPSSAAREVTAKAHPKREEEEYFRGECIQLSQPEEVGEGKQQVQIEWERILTTSSTEAFNMENG